MQLSHRVLATYSICTTHFCFTYIVCVFGLVNKSWEYDAKLCNAGNQDSRPAKILRMLHFTLTGAKPFPLFIIIFPFPLLPSSYHLSYNLPFYYYSGQKLVLITSNGSESHTGSGHPNILRKLRHPKTFQRLTTMTAHFRKSFVPNRLKHYQYYLLSLVIIAYGTIIH